MPNTFEKIAIAILGSTIATAIIWREWMIILIGILAVAILFRVAAFLIR